MKQILVPIICHECGWSGYHLTSMVVIPEFEPELRRAIMEGNYYQAICQCCGSDIKVNHDLIYQDNKHHFVLWYKDKVKQDKQDNIAYENRKLHLRYVSNERALREKILIFEAGLDDRIIEILKIKLKNHLQQKHVIVDQIYFDHYDQQLAILWFIYYDQLIAISYQSYLPYHLETDEDFMMVDESWAKKALVVNE